MFFFSLRASAYTFKTHRLSEFRVRDSVNRHFTRKRQGLPGYWAILFVRAMANYLADRAAPIALSR